jgi:hypothetical protein
VVRRAKLFVLTNENQISFGQNVSLPLQNRSLFGQFTNPHSPPIQIEYITKTTSSSVSVEINQSLQSDRKLRQSQILSLTKREQVLKHFDIIQKYDHCGTLNHPLANFLSLRSYMELK